MTSYTLGKMVKSCSTVVHRYNKTCNNHIMDYVLVVYLVHIMPLPFEGKKK